MNFAIVRPKPLTIRPARQVSTDPAAGFVFPAIVLGLVVVGGLYLLTPDTDSEPRQFAYR